jgi:hypothetical protein
VRTHEYISSLDGTLKAHPVVAIATVIVYMDDGDFGRAAAAIEATDFHRLVAD